MPMINVSISNPELADARIIKQPPEVKHVPTCATFSLSAGIECPSVQIYYNNPEKLIEIANAMLEQAAELKKEINA